MSIMWNLNILVRFIHLTCVMVANKGYVEAFLTDHVTYQDIPATDYTLRSLTKETLVRVVARYFEESNPERYEPEDLLQMDPLTSSLLFLEHFGDCVSSENFEIAVGEIVEGNLAIDRNFEATSDWHFNAEQINEGNRRMVSLRSTILASLNNEVPDYAGIRENIGRYLHLLQDFYSNTNWVELYPDDLNLDLGIRELTDPVATDQDMPCRNCRNIPIEGRPEVHDCKTTLNYNTRFRSLYSGYRSGQDIPKPEASGRSWGKCSHGGTFDSSWTQVATGGINKESSDRSISPHYHLHHQAATLAIQAGEAFFNDEVNGIKALIDDVKFHELVNLDSGRSKVFVMDDTGSMADEIEAAANTALLLVQQFSQSCHSSKQCIISPFNDPDIGPLTNSHDPEVCANALGELYPHGGGDCPELAMSGIEAALQAVIYPADVYVWTDADAKDAGRRPEVLALAQQKNAQINFILTGTCPGRRKRSTDSDDPYSQLSSATGGAVYHATDSDIESVSNIVIADTTASEVSIIRWSNDDFTNISLTVPVDDTMEQITVKVSGPKPRGKTRLVDPFGSFVSFDTDAVEVIVDAENLFIFLLRTSAPGKWVLNLDFISRGNFYQIEIIASSFLDFIFQMLEHGKRGLLVPIDGLPLAGSNVTFVIDIISPELHESADSLLLLDSNGQEILLRSPLRDIAGRSAGIYVTDVVLPEQSFTVSIVGTDLSGTKVQRLHPAVLEVLGFTLAISNINNTVGNLVTGETGSFQLDLGNVGADDTFDLNVIVTTKSSALQYPITARVEPSTIGLDGGSTGSGIVMLEAHETAKAGDSVLVTVNMISKTSGERNYISLSITLAEKIQIVEIKDEDVSSPNCTILTTEGTCTAEMIQNDCSTYFWSLRIALLDDRAISQIVVTDFEISDGNYTLARKNAANIDVIYESNCCCPNMSVAVKDTSGNKDRCGVDYFAEANFEDIGGGQCVRDCDDITECQNGGLCIGGRCDCAPGFNGTLCENNIDDCATNPCLHGGSCYDGVQSYFCNCTGTGYEGLQCENDVDDCFEGACNNGGKCIDGFKSFRCNCTGVGFEGITCDLDINECTLDVCLNAGTCTNMYGSYSCDCLSGWNGRNCHININECERDTRPCGNNATCEDTPGSYRCVCPLGYQGTYCETDIDECGSQPCQNSGVCVDMINRYDCNCNKGYQGNQCQFDVDECGNSTTNNCHSNATCHNTDGSFACKCNVGFEGNGVTCSECGHGRYGVKCNGICTCGDGALCNNVDGDCTCNKVFVNQDCNKANLKVTIMAQNASILDNDNLTLICKVNLPALDIGNIVTWILPDNSTRNISHSGQNNGMYALYLPGIQAAYDIGQYRCVARTNLLGEILQADSKIYIDIIAPGRILKSEDIVESSELAGIAEFNCTVFGNTVFNISWYGINGKILHNVDDKINISEAMHSSLVTSSLLTISNVSRADNGDYACVISNQDFEGLNNELRYDELNFTLVVLERPEIEINSVKSLNGSEIQVAWSVTFDGNLDVDICRVGYTEVPNGTRAVQTTTDSELVLRNLKSFTEYDIDVTCRNKVGLSERVSFKENSVVTNQSEPGVPCDLQLHHITVSSVLLKWRKPDVLNGPIAFYLVELYDENNHTKEIQTSRLQLFVKVDNLDRASNYVLHVRGVNVENSVEYRGNWSDALLFKTLSVYPVQAPIPIASKDINRIPTNTFRINTTPASKMIGPIACYQIVVIPLDKIAKLSNKKADSNYPPSKISGYEISGARQGYPYSAILIQGSDLSDNNEILIGDGRVSNCNMTYPYSTRQRREITSGFLEATNGPLMPGTIYSAFTRAFLLDMEEYSSSPFMEPISTKPSKFDDVVHFSLGDNYKMNEGAVLIKYLDDFAYVCDNQWDINDGHVICKQLGFESAVNVTSGGNFSDGFGYLLDNVECVGNESSLLHCPHSGFGNTSNSCDIRNQVAGVTCRSNETDLRYCDYCASDPCEYGAECKNVANGLGYMCTFISAKYCTTELLPEEIQERVKGPKEGDVRLVGGEDESTGGLEIFHNKQWGSICDDHWNPNNARVACRQLGYKYVNIAQMYSMSVTRHDQPIWLDNVVCDGTELHIADCEGSAWGANDCTHYEDVGLSCLTVDQIDIRLTGGNSTFQGRLEINYKGVWGTVCDDKFSIENANVICKMLGSDIAVEFGTLGGGPMSDPIWLDDLKCLGNERHLLECQHDGFGNSNCEHSEDISVRCVIPDEGAVRLVGGGSSHQGRVEIFHDGYWGTICDDKFGMEDASVICRQLGFDSAVGIYNSATFGEGQDPTWIDDLECVGNEDRVSECPRNEWGQGDCDHTEDAGVTCISRTQASD